MSIYPDALDHLISEIKSIDDREEHQAVLEELSCDYQDDSEYSQSLNIELVRTPNCPSEVYVGVEIKDNLYNLLFTVRNPQGISAKAFTAIIKKYYANTTKEQILSIPEELVYDIFTKDITMGRAQGLVGVIRTIKSLL